MTNPLHRRSKGFDLTRFALLASTAFLAACATPQVDPLLAPPGADLTPAPIAAEAPAPVGATVDPAPAAKNERLAQLFEAYDKANLEASPLSKSYRGIRDEDYGRWDNFSDAAEIADQQRLQATARAMRALFDPAQLSEEDSLSFRLFDKLAKRSASLFPYRELGYLFDQMNGAQSDLPAFLINIHSVDNPAQAEAYISRIAGLGTALDQLTAESRERAERGVMPPKWVYPYVLSDIDNLLEAGTDNAILDDFSEKVAKLDIPAEQKAALEARAVEAWESGAVPAYKTLRAEMVRQRGLAGTDDGVWRLPDGEAYYNALLGYYTTTDLTADQIHELGLKETARIHDEMRAIMRQVGFEGTLQEFFEFTRTDPRFYADSREEYLSKVDAVVEAMEARLPAFFNTLPKSELMVKPVEAFREQSAGKAFYSSPAPDGSRPGTYYVNLYNLKDMSLNELEALAYHEGVPGHHLQRSVQTEMEDLPAFRRFGGFTAYTEGWGLYSEELGKDMGFYTDPYSDFGRLQMELWRAGRLVVDTGIHRKRWSREQAIQWLKENTPNPEGDIEKAIERYIVYPGQATAYMIGKLKIMELREAARAELGDKFDIKAFHDAVLLSGPVPLDILEENVEAWVARVKAG
jgi:uncharacterized protein (DUF885 family)